MQIIKRVKVVYVSFILFCVLIGLAFAADTDSLVVTETGNVGIGTTTPGAKLEINGNATIGATANTSTMIPFRINGLAVSDGAKTYGNYAGMLFDANSGYTVSARRYLITNALRINKFGIIRSVNAKTDPAIGTAGAITSGTADFVIDNTGNVGIGTASPGGKLAVKSSGMSNVIWAQASDGSNLGGIHEGGDGTASFWLYDAVDNMNVLIRGLGDSYLSGGNVGIGITSPQYRLDVNGTIRGSNVSPSDACWKKDIEPIDDALERVSQLRGVHYQWVDNSRGAGAQLGVIAQEVEEVFPEVVSTDNQGYKSVAYGKLVAPLIEAVKELRLANDDLRAENEDFRAQLEELSVRLAALEEK